MGHRRIVRADECPAEQACHLPVRNGAAERLRDPVPDHSLGLCAEGVARIGLSAALSRASTPICGPLPCVTMSWCWSFRPFDDTVPAPLPGPCFSSHADRVCQVYSRMAACHWDVRPA